MFGLKTFRKVFFLLILCSFATAANSTIDALDITSGAGLGWERGCMNPFGTCSIGGGGSGGTGNLTDNGGGSGSSINTW